MISSHQKTNDWSIDFNFEVPSDYQRDFHLRDGKGYLCIKVRGKTCYYKSEGDFERSHLSAHLDWIQECIESVRQEFGQ